MLQTNTIGNQLSEGTLIRDTSVEPLKAKLHIRIQEVQNGFIVTHLKRTWGEVQYVVKDEKELGDMVNELVSKDK